MNNYIRNKVTEKEGLKTLCEWNTECNKKCNTCPCLHMKIRVDIELAKYFWEDLHANNNT